MIRRFLPGAGLANAPEDTSKTRVMHLMIRRFRASLEPRCVGLCIPHLLAHDARLSHELKNTTPLKSTQPGMLEGGIREFRGTRGVLPLTARWLGVGASRLEISLLL